MNLWPTVRLVVPITNQLSAGCVLGFAGLFSFVTVSETDAET